MKVLGMRERYRKYFGERFRRYGEDVRTLWGNDLSQEQRFAIFCEIGDLEGQSVLDVGCGFGDFFGYLRARKIRVSDYMGLDCVDEILAKARCRYPEARFSSCDLSDLASRERFDYVFASGIFFLPASEWESYVLETVRAMYAISRLGVATNFLSRFSSSRDELSHYADPGRLLATLMDGVTPIIELRHSYRSNDFTVFLYRNYSSRLNK